MSTSPSPSPLIKGENNGSLHYNQYSNRLVVWWLAILIHIIYAGVLWHSIQNKSATVDELSHLATGLYSLSTGDFRMNRTAPPLQNVACAIPVMLVHDFQLDYDNESWRKGIWNGSGDRLLEANPETFHQLLMAGRMGSIALSVLLCWVVFVWAKEVWGGSTALLVLLVTAFEPNLMAHGRLTTTDTASVLCFVLTGYSFWKFLRNPTWKWLLFMGAGFGLAWYAKHSGVVLLPALLIGTGVMVWMQPERFRYLFVFTKQLTKPWFVIVVPLVSIVVIVFTGLMMIWAGYGFEIGDSIAGERRPNQSYIWSGIEVPLRSILYMLGYDGAALINSVDPNQPLWLFLRGYLPAFSHWEGYFANRAHLTSGHLGYFMGELSMYGWRSYYPVLFLIKTPVGLLILLGLGAVLLAARHVNLRLQDWTALGLIPLLYLLVIVFFNTANIGYRHALPVIPFVILIFAGAALRYCINGLRHIRRQKKSTERSTRSDVLFAVILFMCIGLQTGYVVQQHPHYLSYFNMLIGGPKNGHYFAVDSNLDWGQDLLYVKDYIEQNKLGAVNVLYFGPPSLLDAYEVPYTNAKELERFEPGTYIVSTSLLHGIGAGKVMDKLNVFRTREPDAYITPAVFMYRIDAVTSDE